MKLGFIGTGNISSDVITGICRSNLKFKQIIISPRNKKKAKKLEKEFKKVKIAKNNQEVINKSDWIFIGVLPKVGEKILSKLIFKQKQIVISFMSTTKYAKLKKLIKKKLIIIRAIPIPPIKTDSPSEIASTSTSIASSKKRSNKTGESFETLTASLKYLLRSCSSYTISIARPPNT